MKVIAGKTKEQTKRKEAIVWSKITSSICPIPNAVISFDPKVNRTEIALLYQYSSETKLRVAQDIFINPSPSPEVHAGSFNGVLLTKLYFQKHTNGVESQVQCSELNVWHVEASQSINLQWHDFFCT